MSNQRNGEPNVHNDITMLEYKFKSLKIYQTTDDSLSTNNAPYGHNMASNDYY